MDRKMNNYRWENIQTLLINLFYSARELRDVFSNTPDFRPFFQEVPPHTGINEMIIGLIDYAKRRELMEKLLTLLREYNPARYEQYQLYHISLEYTSPPSPPPPEPELVYSKGVQAEPEILRLRLDAAVPDRVMLGRAFDLAVAIRQLASPILAEDDLEQVQSGEVQFDWPEAEPFVRLRVQVESAECDIQGADSHSFRLYRGQDSPVFYFQLIPKEIGGVGIIVVVYQEDDWLGSTRVRTTARKQAAGKVKLNVTSEPVGVNEELESLRKQLIQRHSNLHKLKEQAAIYGAGETPLFLLNQIEAEQQAIGEIEAKLAG